jgi:4'-phosphopantetheinyl transferase
VSATDGLLAAAVSDEGPVGLDVESVRAVAAAPVAAVLLHPREAARGGTGPRALAMTWVRKEALLKATGHGLRIPPSSLELTAAHAVPALLAAPAELGVGPLDVRLADLTDVELAEVEDHVGAVAVLVRR